MQKLSYEIGFIMSLKILLHILFQFTDHSQSSVFNNNCNEFPYIAGLSTLFITSIASGIACMLFMRYVTISIFQMAL